ncbi:uncharacterized protein FJT64_010401 [Amphibalanus amphitrite]|uniref:RNA-directed DNA polymerase n=1 Tax=Amphibalanus amphitrite TaxID=1232801 RepID=A0A6A4VQF8_AMPAM|nr:uncharacterized protein FJT64_010401 [Amphibalanus amphitrite]
MDTPTETGAVVQESEQVRLGAGLDPRLIDEYDGSGDVVEWHTQASLLCEYRGVSAAEVLPMRLKGGAFAVWSQLSAVDRRSATATRDALFKAFAMDDFAAHTAFVARRLEPGESADVFLASLRRYAALFGGVTDRQLVAAFVNGLPASVADTIRAGTSGTAKVTMECQGKRVTLAAFVVPDRPLGVDMVLGMSGITALGGISLRTPTDVRICAAAAAEVDPQGLALDAADFSARFEARTGEWTVAWKWADGEGPEYLQNQLVSHLPVVGWLRPAAAWLKRRVNALTAGWDDPTEDVGLRGQVDHVVTRLNDSDPARGPWRLKGGKLVVWTDASSIAAGVVLEDPEGGVVEDASWLRPESKAAMHINMAELDAALSGVNMAIAWGITIIDLCTDSATVHKWIDDALTGRSRLRTKAHGEMLIRRRIDVIRQLVEEFNLRLTVVLVKSADNLADALTRVPKEWLQTPDPEPAARPVAAAAIADPRPDVDPARIRAVHESTGHQGVRRTLWYVRRNEDARATRSAVRAVIQQCDVCQSIDPAPVRWQQGSLSVPLTWERLAIDVTHYRERSYLTVIDCGPSRYGIWRLLRRSDAAEVTNQLENIFLERGAPAELLLDNATEFRSRRMAAFAARWGVRLRFRAVHEAGGNGIVERHHRTVKVMAARQGCTIGEAVHRYNATPRDGMHPSSAPAAGVFQRAGHDLPLNIDEPGRAVSKVDDGVQSARKAFRVGDAVWIRRRGQPTRCTDVSRRGVVTRLLPAPLVEVDGAPWHVRCVRRRFEEVGDTDSMSDWLSLAVPVTAGSSQFSLVAPDSVSAAPDRC